MKHKGSTAGKKKVQMEGPIETPGGGSTMIENAKGGYRWSTTSSRLRVFFICGAMAALTMHWLVLVLPLFCATMEDQARHGSATSVKRAANGSIRRDPSKSLTDGNASEETAKGFQTDRGLLASRRLGRRAHSYQWTSTHLLGLCSRHGDFIGKPI